MDYYEILTVFQFLDVFVCGCAIATHIQHFVPELPRDVRVESEEVSNVC